MNDPPAKLSPFQKVLQFPVKGPDGKEFAVLEVAFPKDNDGGMVRAFFDKDSDEFATAVKEKDAATQQKLIPERHGEREALIAWSKLARPRASKGVRRGRLRAARRLAKQADHDGLSRRQDKVKVKSIITDRCIRCHAGRREGDV